MATYFDSFETDFGNWTNSASDDFDWIRNTGETSSATTGPDFANNDPLGYYIYIEASSPRVQGEEAIIESPTLNEKGGTISFYYHMFGTNMGSLHLEEYNGTTWSSVWSQSGSVQSAEDDPYEYAEVEFSPGTQKLRFRGVVGATYSSDIGLDDITITESETVSISITVDSVDRSSSINFESVKKEDNLNSLVDILQFSTKYHSGSTWRPDVNSEVLMSVDGTTVFGGIISEVNEVLEGHFLLRYDVVCKDFSHLLDRNIIIERYESGETVQEVIQDLVTKYSTGFTTTNVGGASLTPDVVTFDSITLSECITNLAKQYNYSWYVDYDKDIHFFALNDEVAPFDLTDSSANYEYDSLSIEKDFTQLRNRVRLRGGEATINTRTETHSGTGTKTEFALAYKYATKPTVEVSSVAQTVGIDNIDDDSSFDCMWSYNEKYIRFTSGNEPASGTDNIEVTGDPLLPLNVIVSDGVSISTYGLYEFYMEEPRLTTKDDALAYAQAELDAHKDPILSGEFLTHEPGLRSGQVININSTFRDINEDFIIEKVSMSTYSSKKMSYRVKISTYKTLTLTELLQSLLRKTDVDINELESIFQVQQYTDDFSIVDSSGITISVHSSPPYYWADATVNGNEMVWNKFTWT